MKNKLIKIWNIIDDYLLKITGFVLIVLLVVLGCCADYKYQKMIVKDAINETKK